MEHLVESHMGSYYISDSDPEFIEMYCETCGDYDSIVASWNPEEEKGRLNGLLSYFMMDVLNNREDINRKIDEYDEGPIEVEDIIPSIINDIEYNSDLVSSIVYDLFEYHDISDEEYRKIIQVSDFEEDRQIKMIKHFEKEMIVKDDRGKVKIKRI